MDKDQKFWLRCWFIIGLTLSAVSWAVAWGVVSHTRAYTENGFVQVYLQGREDGIWQKPKPEDHQ